MTFDRAVLINQVQHNCHIADARHGTDFGLCTYLMKMREYYRWETGLPYTETLDKDSVGDWLTQREELWDGLGEQDYRSIELADGAHDPFDADAINASLHDSGLMYSAGLIQGGRAQFFLTELDGTEQGEDGFQLWVGRRELARGLYAPPAMTRGRSIFLRRNALKQLLWEKYESWLWSRPDNAMGRAVASYPFLDDVDMALELMTIDEMQVVRAHEVGEYRVGVAVGDAWESMLMTVLGTPAELMLRAVRDNWADCLETLPLILSWPSGHPSLHTYVGNLGNMRKSLSPSLLAAYEAWRQGDPAALHAVVEKGVGHWQSVAEQALALYAAGSADPAQQLADLMGRQPL
jgi:hypothetical protein